MAKKVFVTYSWDSPEHEDWVMKLVNTLRENDGIDATLDKYEIQEGTVNLNRMMVNNIHNYDYIVIILTEGYKKKANEELGGVGFESTMLMDIIKKPEERNKIILLNRHTGDFNSTIPYFTRGYNLIDVSDNKLEEGYNDLVRRIEETPKFEKPELNQSRKLEPKNVGTFSFGKVKLPNLKPITHQSKEEFLKDNFNKFLNCQIKSEVFSYAIP